MRSEGARVAAGEGQHRGPGWRMAAAYKWHCHTMDAAFEPRDGAGLLSLNGRLWMLGGWK